MNLPKEPFESYADDPIFNILAVTQQTHIDPATLRAWERRYHIPKPKRDVQGHRLYSERDIMILRWLKNQVDASVRIKQAVEMLYLQAPQSLSKTTTVAAPQTGSFDRLIQEFVTAIQSFDYINAHQTITRALGLYPVEDVCINFLMPAIAYIGSEWEKDALTLQMEHFASNLIRERLQAMLAGSPLPTRPGRVIIGCAPLDWHELGGLTLALLMRWRGWEVIYLGQNVGLAGLGQTLTDLKPQALTLSASRLPGMRYLANAAHILHEATNGRGVFTFAGRIFNVLPHFTNYVPGVYLGADLLTAIDQLEAVLSQPKAQLPRYAPPTFSERTSSALTVFRQYRAEIESTAIALLLPHTSEMAEVPQAVHELMEVMLLALQYDDPTLADEMYHWAYTTLPTYGIPHSVTEDFLGAWQAYIDQLLPLNEAKIINSFVESLRP